MKHPDRWDLPKGHRDPGEDDRACALRELEEETGYSAADVEMVPNFSWQISYQVHEKRDGNQLVQKTVTYYLARLLTDKEPQLTEHPDYRWFPWTGTHQIQEKTIDPLLAEVARYFSQH